MHFCWRGHTLLLRCHIQPKARDDEFCGVHGERLKIRLKAPPLDGKANQRLLRFIADAFGVTRADVNIVRGQRSRHKELSIHKPLRLPPQCLL